MKPAEMSIYFSDSQNSWTFIRLDRLPTTESSTLLSMLIMLKQHHADWFVRQVVQSGKYFTRAGRSTTPQRRADGCPRHYVRGALSATSSGHFPTAGTAPRTLTMPDWVGTRIAPQKVTKRSTPDLAENTNPDLPACGVVIKRTNVQPWPSEITTAKSKSRLQSQKRIITSGHLLIRSACNWAAALSSRIGLFNVVSVYDLLLRNKKWG